MYKIDCENSVYFYDEQRGIIYDEDRMVVNPPHTTKIKSDEQQYFVVTDDTRFNYNTKNIKFVRISLGTACNYRCKYCLESQHDKRPVKVFVDEIINNIIKSGIRVDLIERIDFWGGEPLLYWDCIKSLVDGFEQIGFVGIFTFTTNGSLFTDQIADFCIKHKIHAIFSHDGPTFTKYRYKKDWLDDENIRKQVLRMHQHDLANTYIVVGPHNNDFNEIIKYFESKFGRKVKMCWSRPLRVYSRDDYFFDFYKNKQAVNKLTEQYYLGIKSNNEYFTNCIRHKNEFMERLLRNAPEKCSYGLRSLTCDPRDSIIINNKGELIPCANTTIYNKTIGGDICNLSQAYITIPSQHVNRKRCLKCLYRVACGGLCTNINDTTHMYVCYSTKPYFKALFRAAIEDIIKDVVISIKRTKHF